MSTLSREETQANETGKLLWIKNKASGLHQKVPGIRKLPFSAVAIILFLIFINVAVWIIVAIVLVCLLLNKMIMPLTPQ
jgi:Flp pilus assembly protein TadB